MALVTRTYTFTDGTTAYGSQVEAEIANIVNTLNSLDTVSLKWNQVSILNATNVPLTADNSSGSQDIVDFKANGVIKVSVSSTGLLKPANGVTVSGASLTMSGQTIVMGSNKITGLAAATVNGDAVRFEQINGFRILQIVQATTVTVHSTTSSTFAASNLTANITPSSTASKILIMVSAYGQQNVSGVEHFATIARGGSNLGGSNGMAAQYTASGGNGEASLNMMFLDSPASVSTLTYAAYHRNTNNTQTMDFGSANTTQTIILMEIG